MKSLVKFRLFAVRIAIMLTLICAIVVYPFFGRTVSNGLLLGGLAGTLVFWVTARHVEKVATEHSNAVYSLPMTWRLAGFIVYIIVLVRGYTLDKESFSGLVAVAVGLFMIRLAAVVLGITGWDLPKEEN